MASTLAPIGVEILLCYPVAKRKETQKIVTQSGNTDGKNARTFASPIR
ncbi:hypothetical protein [Flavobacterium cheonhonense]|nr:hypothetical protein [Flavobacterium cheonhonense]